MKIKKGMKLVFKNRSEVILKASNDRVNGMLVSDKAEYSVDYIMRWLEFGFVKLEKG
jgi:methylase of polypeptide subunit release factors